MDLRIKKIINLINEHKPKVIIFNGIGNGKYKTFDFWERIVGDKFEEVTFGRNRYFLKKKQTNFFIIPKLIYAANEVIFNIGKEANKIFTN